MISRPSISRTSARSFSTLVALLILFMPVHLAIAQGNTVLHVPADHPAIQQAIDAAPLVNVLCLLTLLDLWG